ncbi:hypothetical protein PSPO01_14626 [Paraphaeosphaeria sporulosa]
MNFWADLDLGWTWREYKCNLRPIHTLVIYLFRRKVTLAAVTSESDIRIHEDSVHLPTDYDIVAEADNRPTIHITTCLDLRIAMWSTLCHTAARAIAQSSTFETFNSRSVVMSGPTLALLCLASENPSEVFPKQYTAHYCVTAIRNELCSENVVPSSHLLRRGRSFQLCKPSLSCSCWKSSMSLSEFRISRIPNGDENLLGVLPMESVPNTKGSVITHDGKGVLGALVGIGAIISTAQSTVLRRLGFGIHDTACGLCKGGDAWAWLRRVTNRHTKQRVPPAAPSPPPPPAMSPTTLDAAEALMRALRAIHDRDPESASGTLPSARFLAQCGIHISDATQNPHPHRARLNVLVSTYAPDQHHRLEAPAVDVVRRASTLEWADLLAESAHSIMYAVAEREACAMPPTAVTAFAPDRYDMWLEALYEPLWEWSLAWRVQHGLKVGDGCSGECDRAQCCDIGTCFGKYCHENVVGCLLPVRAQPKADADGPLHLGELVYALMLLHRQLKRNSAPLGCTVTIVAVTTEGQIRVHEASVQPPTDAHVKSTPWIRIAKCLELRTTDFRSRDPAVQDDWLNIMSYLCFTHEANLNPYPDEQLVPVEAAMRENDLVIGASAHDITTDITASEHKYSHSKDTRDITASAPDATKDVGSSAKENVLPPTPAVGGKRVLKPAPKTKSPREPAPAQE